MEMSFTRDSTGNTTAKIIFGSKKWKMADDVLPLKIILAVEFPVESLVKL